MIITITGKPCSGKGTVSKIFCNKYKFDYLCTGDMFRKLANEYGYKSVLDFQENFKDIEKIDNIIDSQTYELGKQKINENIVFDSRLAWHFIPDSFKVFIDINWQDAAKRLLGANRTNEQAKNLEDAEKKLKDRWKVENDRYLKIYNTNNTNPKNYDLVIDSSYSTPEEVADLIYAEYLKFTRKV